MDGRDAGMSKGIEIKANQSHSGIQSPLVRMLMSAESRARIGSHLPWMTFKDVRMFAAGHLTAHGLSFSSEKHSAQ